MTLTSKFRKDISILRAAANREIYLDVKNPKLFKKVKKYYERVELVSQPLQVKIQLEDYDILIVECNCRRPSLGVEA
jgi:hypothetical protein